MKKFLLLLAAVAVLGCGKSSDSEPVLTEDQYQKNVDESNELQQKAAQGKPLQAG